MRGADVAVDDRNDYSTAECPDEEGRCISNGSSSAECRAWERTMLPQKTQERHRTTKPSPWDFTDGQTSHGFPGSVCHDNGNEGGGEGYEDALEQADFHFYE